MNIPMTTLCIVILAIAVVFGSMRYLALVWRSDKSLRPKSWRVVAIVLLQIASAIALYFSLFPPPTYTRAESLVILTAHAQVKSLGTGDRGFALPEANNVANTPRIPDLATALRRYPGVRHLQVFGDGLSARDQDAARGLSIDFRSSMLPRGLVELSMPDDISSGSQWQLQGQIHDVDKARVELLDPGNNIAASTTANNDGSFVLKDVARTPGLAMYQLRISDSDKKIIETLKLPLNIVQTPALKVLSLSGGPNPELKYLRRWAVDSGVELESQINLSPGVQISSASTAINAGNLGKLDLLILDERAWSTMNHGAKQAVLDALHEGLGVLLRITGPLNGNDRSELRSLGFAVEDASIVQTVRLKNAGEKQPALTRRPIRVRSNDAVPMLQDDTDNALALWRGEGRGRIGLWWLTDSYKLILSDNDSAHGQIWRDAVSTLARTHTASSVFLRDKNIRENERAVFCNLPPKSFVRESDAAVIYLLPDSKNCAAYWPRQSGWHLLDAGEQEMPFYVRGSDEAPGLKANAIFEATSLLAAKKSSGANSSRVPVPGSHWPWFFIWLSVTVLLWLLERSRRGYANR